MMARGTVLFDLDGTLVDSALDLADALDTLLRERNCAPMGLAGTRKLIGHGIPSLVREALAVRGIALDERGLDEAVKQYLNIYTSHLSRKTRAYPRASEALAALRRDGWRLAVCTNKLEASARTLLADLGLLDAFELVVGPDTFGVAKPDPRHLLHCLPEAEASAPRNAVFVGDSAVDLEAARSAGIPVALVDWGYSQQPIRELGADAVVSCFDQIPETVETLAGHGRLNALPTVNRFNSAGD